MGTPPELKLRWAHEALGYLADEARQRRAWFRSDRPDSPGDQICDLLPMLEEGDQSFITDPELAHPPEVQAVLRRLRDSVITYQQKVGRDPDPWVTISHPKWQEIRALAREVLTLIFPSS